jgi:hypothetical protein
MVKGLHDETERQRYGAENNKNRRHKSHFKLGQMKKRGIRGSKILNYGL